MKEITPALIIGIGGTGKEIIYNIRRRFYQEYGVVGFPVTRYVEMDTDSREEHLVSFGEEGKLDSFSRQRLLLQPNEFVKTTIFSDLLPKIKKNKDAYRNILEWFPERLLEIPSNLLEHGAGGIRPLGRLAFFANYQEIFNAIQNDSFRSEKAVQDAQQFGVKVNTSETRIYVIFSIAGGTGSGAFLDMAYLVRKLYPGSKKVTAFVVSPEVFTVSGIVHSKDFPKLMANGYAALKEMEWFTAQSHPDYQINWATPHAPNALSTETDSSPFDHIFLVGPRSLKSVTHLSASTIFEMIGDSIFNYHTNNEFASTMFASLVNTSHEIGTTIFQSANKFNMRFSTIYSAFGMSQIGFIRHGIRIASGFQGLSKLFKFFGNGKPTPPDFSNEVDDFATDILDLDRAFPELADDLINNKLLKALTLSGGTTLDRRIVLNLRQSIENLGRDDTEMPPEILRKTLANYMTKTVQFTEKYIEQFTEDANPHKVPRAEHLRTIDNNTESSFKKLCSELDRKLREYLADPFEQGYSWAENMLVELSTYLRNLADILESVKKFNNRFLIPAYPELPNLSGLDDIQMMLESAGDVKWPMFKSRAKKLITAKMRQENKKFTHKLQQISGRFIESVIETASLHILMVLLDRTIDNYKKLIADFAQYVEKRKETLFHFKNYSEQLSEHFGDFAGGINRISSSERNKQVFSPTPEKLESIVLNKYQRWHEFHQEIIRNIGEEDVRLNLGHLLWKLAELGSAGGALVDLVKSELEHAARESTNGIFNESLHSIWSETTKKSDDIREAIIENARFALPYYMAGETPVSDKSNWDGWCGCTANLQPYVEEAWEKIIESTSGRKVDISPVMDDKILFYTELSRLALPQFSVVNKLSEAYHSFQSDLYYPHMDKRLHGLMRDVIAVSDKEADELKQLSVSLIEGLVYGIAVRLNRDEQWVWSIERPPSQGGIAYLAPTLEMSAHLLKRGRELSYEGNRITLEQYLKLRIQEAKDNLENNNAVLILIQRSLNKIATDISRMEETGVENPIPISHLYWLSDEIKDKAYGLYKQLVSIPGIEDIQKKADIIEGEYMIKHTAPDFGLGRNYYILAFAKPPAPQESAL